MTPHPSKNQHSHLSLDTSWFYTFWWLHWSSGQWTSKTNSLQPQVATCYPNTSYTCNWPPTKHHIKTSIQSCVESSSQSNLGTGTAWRLVCIAWWKLVPDRLAGHLAPPGASPLDFCPGPVLQHIAWRDHLRHQMPTLGFCYRVHFVAYLLAVYTVPPDATPVTGDLLVLRTLE